MWQGLGKGWATAEPLRHQAFGYRTTGTLA